MLRRRLSGEEGIAMIVVTAVLLVVSFLALAFASAARDANSVTVRDSSSKRALAAAEAGLQVATQRYAEHRFALAANLCLAGANAITPTTPLAGPECPAVTDGGQLGDGAAFSYVISLPGASCPATPIAAEDAIDATLARCVTATGTVQGVRRRVQARLALDDSPPFFKNAGLVGFDSVSMQPNATIGAADARVNVGSNGPISLNNGVNVWGDAMLAPPAGSFAANGGTLHGSQLTLADSFELELDHEFAKAKTSPPNSNGLLPTSVYTAATRSFRLSSGTYTLPAVSPGPTIYHFCSFDLAEGTRLQIPSGSEVRIYIDSTTPCAGSSDVTFRKGVCVNFSDCSGTWEMGTPATASLLKFYLAGAGRLGFEQGSKVSGVFFAPKRAAEFTPQIRFNGGLAAKSVSLFPQLALTWPEDSKKAIHGEDQTTRNGWFECKPAPDPPGDPESGC